jgi:hypothetical protein
MVIANKELIKLNIKAFARDVGRLIKDLFNFIRSGIPILLNMIQKLGGLSGILKKVAIGFMIFTGSKLLFGVINIVRGLGGMAKGLQALGLVAGAGAPEILAIVAAMTAMFLIFEDIFTYMKGGDSVTGMVVEYFKKLGNAMLSSFSPKTLEALQTFAALITKLIPAFKDLGLDILKNFFESIDETIRGIANTITWVINMIAAIREGKGLDFLYESMTKEGGKIADAFKEGYEKGGKGWGGFLEGISNVRKKAPETAALDPMQMITMGARSLQTAGNMVHNIEISVKDKGKNIESVKYNNQNINKNNPTNYDVSKRIQQMSTVGGPTK